MKNIGVILAGGTGSRMGYQIPKQFLEVGGKRIIEHTVDVFQKSPVIDEIAIVIHPFYQNEMKNIVVNNGWDKVKKILTGGEERYQSTLMALQAYEQEAERAEEEINLILHDGARPLVSEVMIEQVVHALKVHEAVGTAIPAVDTMAEIEPQTRQIVRMPERSTMYHLQTPQGFRLKVLAQAFALARQDMIQQDKPLKVSDDCGMIFQYLPEIPIYIVEGDAKNLKLTYESDLSAIEKLFQA